MSTGTTPAPGTPGRAFVGRERELAELRAGLRDALAGRGRLFLVVGEAGIGKTRLATELQAGLEPGAARVLRGGAYYNEARFARCAFRNWNYPGSGLDFLGFRVVASPFFSRL